MVFKLSSASPSNPPPFPISCHVFVEQEGCVFEALGLVVLLKKNGALHVYGRELLQGGGRIKLSLGVVHGISVKGSSDSSILESESIRKFYCLSH